jgi:hypothetical protein
VPLEVPKELPALCRRNEGRILPVQTQKQKNRVNFRKYKFNLEKRWEKINFICSVETVG